MIVFEISVNGKPLYRTGVGDVGMLTAEVMWSRFQHQGGAVSENLYVSATSMHGKADAHAAWTPWHLEVGDEVRIRIVDADDFDEPDESGTLDDLRPK